MTSCSEPGMPSSTAIERLRTIGAPAHGRLADTLNGVERCSPGGMSISGRSKIPRTRASGSETTSRAVDSVLPRFCTVTANEPCEPPTTCVGCT